MSQYDLDIELVMKALLEASSTLSALVGSRIYLDTRPEDDPLPAVVFEVITNRQENSCAVGEEIWKARFQVNCLGSKAKTAVDVRRAVLQACNKKSGTVAGISVISCLHDGVNGSSYDRETESYLKPIDFIVHYWR